MTFAFPFENFDERCIDIISHIDNIQIIRISELDRSFKYPYDLHHVKITSWDINEALHLLNDFINDESAELFVFVAHSYDFEFDNTYDKLEKLCQKLKERDDITVIPMKELLNL